MSDFSDPGAGAGAGEAWLQQFSFKKSLGVPSVPLSKLVFDKLMAAALLTFFAPFLAVISIAILVTDGGPVVFGHERMGRGGRPFRCLKFRTMVRDADVRLEALLEQDPEARAEWEATRKLSNDPRISCLGRILRRSSLDELPQLWNVLRGDMSMVGPRPIPHDESCNYKEHYVDYLSVLPGLTGAWQVSGRSNTTYDERVALDVDYIRNRTFVTDLRIVARTVAVVVLQEGAR